MPRGRRKNPENHTPQEAIAYCLQWADRTGYADVPAVAALRGHPTKQHIYAAIQWAEQQNLRNVAAHLRERALCPMMIDDEMKFDEEARSQLLSIINQIAPEQRRAIIEMPEGDAVLLHHGLGTSIRNRIRSGELRALCRWSREQAPDATSLDEMAWPIILEISKVLRTPPSD